MQGHLKKVHGLSYSEMLNSGQVNFESMIADENLVSSALTESETFDSNLIKVVCEICFESFDSKAASDQHYQEEHMNDNNEEETKIDEIDNKTEIEIDNKTEISPCDIKEGIIVKEEPMD